MQPGDVSDAPLLSVRAVRSALLLFERVHGRRRLEQLWEEARLPLPLGYLARHTNFISLRFAEDMFEALAAASGDPDFMRRAGMASMSPEALGFFFHVLKAFGNPRLCYVKAVEMAAV